MVEPLIVMACNNLFHRSKSPADFASHGCIHLPAHCLCPREPKLRAMWTNKSVRSIIARCTAIKCEPARHTDSDVQNRFRNPLSTNYEAKDAEHLGFDLAMSA
jgi:hypothetical protein